MIKRIILLINPRLLQLFALFFLGLVIGSACVVIQYGVRIDTLMLEKENLQEELSVTREELQSVKDNLSERSRTKINGIEPEITILDDAMGKYERESLQIEIAKQVKAMLEPVKGMELDKLDYLLVPQIVDQRIVEVDGRQYTLSTTLVVIAETLVVHVNVAGKQEQKKMLE